MNKPRCFVLIMLLSFLVGLILIHCSDDGDKCDCKDRVCGPHPDTTNCADTVCGECGQNQQCTTQGACEACTPSCGDRVCGLDVDECCCCGECEQGKECDPDGQCVDACCPGQALHGFVQGMAIEFPPGLTPTPIEIQLAAVGGLDAYTHPDNPTHLEDLMSDQNGMYKTSCLDLSSVNLGLLMLTDDNGFDGTGGDWYPTYSGVLGISRDEDKVCVRDAPVVFGVPNTVVQLLVNNAPGMSNIVTDGFAIVFILDADNNPVPGAVLKKADGDNLDAVVYPNALFDNFDGQNTSASGIVLVPGPLLLVQVKPEKTNMTWGIESMGTVAGYCFTRPMIAVE